MEELLTLEESATTTGKSPMVFRDITTLESINALLKKIFTSFAPHLCHQWGPKAGYIILSSMLPS